MGHNMTTDGLLDVCDKHGSATRIGDNLVGDKDRDVVLFGELGELAEELTEPVGGIEVGSNNISKTD